MKLVVELSTVKRADNLLVFRGGKIVEQGSLYRQLCNIQFRTRE